MNKTEEEIRILENEKIQLLRALKALYNPAKIAVNQIICLGGDTACQPCQNRERLAIALDNAKKLLLENGSYISAGGIFE